MLTLNRSTCFALLLGFFAGCSKSDDQAAGTSATAGGLAASDIAGRWNMTAIPFSGDTTPTRFVLTATGNADDWTLTFPGRPPVPTRVRFDADSIITEAGPYESVRRKGVQVRTKGVMRLEGDSLVGTTIARYTTQGADSVLHLRTSGTRAKP